MAGSVSKYNRAHQAKTNQLVLLRGEQNNCSDVPCFHGNEFQSLGFRMELLAKQSTSTCKGPGKYKVPFFVDRMGPRFMEFTVNAHEASPGHHIEGQGYVENFR